MLIKDSEKGKLRTKIANKAIVTLSKPLLLLKNLNLVLIFIAFCILNLNITNIVKVDINPDTSQ